MKYTDEELIKLGRASHSAMAKDLLSMHGITLDILDDTQCLEYGKYVVADCEKNIETMKKWAAQEKADFDALPSEEKKYIKAKRKFDSKWGHFMNEGGM